MTEKQKLKITIFDKDYSLLVENQEIAEKLAKYVDKVMEETQAELKNQPTETIAVISALNIAYELFLEKDRFREFSVQSIDKIKKIKLLLNEPSLNSDPS